MRAAERRDYEEYVSARLPKLHRAAYLLCGDADRADDLVQTTVTKLYRHWRVAKEAENLDGYVHRILTRAFIDEKRLAWSRVWLFGRLGEYRDAGEFPAGSAVERIPQDQIDERETVINAMRRLPRGQRVVIVLRFLCDLPVEDVAAILGCSTGNVKSQTSRGLAFLRPILKADLSYKSPQPAHLSPF